MNAKAFLQGYLSKTALDAVSAGPQSSLNFMQPGVLQKNRLDTSGMAGQQVATAPRTDSTVPNLATKNAVAGAPAANPNPIPGASGMLPASKPTNSIATDTAITNAKTTALPTKPSGTGSAAATSSSIGNPAASTGTALT